MWPRNQGDAAPTAGHSAFSTTQFFEKPQRNAYKNRRVSLLVRWDGPSSRGEFAHSISCFREQTLTADLQGGQVGKPTLTPVQLGGEQQTEEAAVGLTEPNTVLVWFTPL